MQMYLEIAEYAEKYMYIGIVLSYSLEVHCFFTPAVYVIKG